MKKKYKLLMLGALLSLCLCGCSKTDEAKSDIEY